MSLRYFLAEQGYKKPEVGLAFVRGGKKLATAFAEIADTGELRRIGLSKRASLPADRAMFFDKAGTFWMKDVNFPLDLVFVDKRGKILEKYGMVVDKTGSTLYAPTKKADHAIELPFGFIDKYGIKEGDKAIPFSVD